MNESANASASARAGASLAPALVIRLDPRVDLPQIATAGSAGFDLQAAIPSPVTLWGGQSQRIPTGLKVWIQDPRICGLVFPRSGLGTKGIVLKNLTGVVDSDYQGEWIVTVWNTNPDDSKPILIQPLDRIAQVVFVPIVKPRLELVDSPDGEFTHATGRGKAGFGSTGGTASSIAYVGGNYGG